MSAFKTKDFGSCNVLFDAFVGVGNSSFASNKGSTAAAAAVEKDHVEVTRRQL